MKITFIQPGMGKKQGQKYVKSWLMEPLNVAVLAGLTPNGIEIEFFDDRIDKIPYDTRTDLIAITVETYTARRAYQIADKFRQKGIKVILGGFHPTLMPNEALEHADSIIIGEAEANWKLLIEDYKKNKLKKIYTKKSESLAGIFPKRDIFQKYKNHYLPVALVESSRGCPFVCNFCSVTQFYGHSQKFRPIEDAVRDIKNSNKKIIFIVDDNLGTNIERTKELFQALIPLKIKWASQMSINLALDKELMELAAKSGCIFLLIGFESLNKRNLNMMHKKINIDLEQNKRALDNIRKAGIMVYGTFVFGYEYDDRTAFKKTLDFAIKEKISLAAFNYLLPFPGTPLYNYLETNGKLLYKKWWLDSSYKFGDIVFKPNRLSSKELERLCYDYRKKFYNPLSVIKRLPNYAHYRSLFNLFFYLSQSIFALQQIKLRQGLPLGEGLE